MASTFPYRSPRVKKILKIILPWILCAAIFAYIFSKTPPRELWQSLQYANVPLLALYAVIYFFIAHSTDCWALKHFISRFAAPVTHRESWIARGVSYLVMILNYQIAQGAFVIYFKKTHNIPAAKTLGTLAFINLLDIVLIASYAGVAMLFATSAPVSAEFRASLLTLLTVIYLVYALFVLFWKNTNSRFISKHKRFRPVRWLLDHDMFLIFREATLKDFIVLIGYRLILTFIAMGAFNFALFPFDAKIDWGTLYTYNPVVLLIGCLPITPAGLGTVQVLLITFFKDHIQSPLITSGTVSPETLLLTTSLVWMALNQALKALFGSVCLSLSPKKMFTH